MKKLNWQLEFFRETRKRSEIDFVWGENDCVLFAADMVILMGNEDPAEKSRGAYNSEASAKVHLVKEYGDLYSAWDQKLERLTTVNIVQNGDVVVYDGELGLTTGIYWNGGIFAPTMTGVRYADGQHSKILAAWRV